MDTSLIQTLNCKNVYTNSQVSEGFQAWPTSVETCFKRANIFKALKEALASALPDDIKKTQSAFDKVATYSESLGPLLREASDVEKEGYSQILFEGSPWSEINFIPFALVILSVFKSYIVPTFSILLPLMSWILPYIFLRLVYNIPIEFTDYMRLLWRMWNGQAIPRTPEELLGPVPEDPPVEAGTRIKQLVQNGWTLFTLGQALWQPIQQAKHFMKLDKDCYSLGEMICGFRDSAKQLVSCWNKWFPSWFLSWIELCPGEPRQAFAFVHETPFWLLHMFRGIGRFEVLFRLAERADTVPVNFIRTDINTTEKSPILILKGFGDPSIPLDRRILSSISLGRKQPLHTIVTGPNRGGKSSCMRGVLLNVMTAHAFGAAFSENAYMTYYSWIADGMRLDDFPGTVSMFEREVGFASSILNKTDGGLGIVLYDELFHSTNPPDATRTSDIFCKGLWNKKNCISIISTHVYSLARNAPSNVKALCVGAHTDDDNKIHFSYKLQRGICELSSVDLLLKQHSLI